MAVDVNYIVLMFVAIVLGLAFGILGIFAAKLNSNEPLDLKKLIVSCLYSVIIAVIMVGKGDLTFENLAQWQNIFTVQWQVYFVIYLGIMYIVTKVFDPAAKWIARKAVQKLTPLSFSVEYPNGSNAPCLVKFKLLTGKISKFFFGDGNMWDGQGNLEHTYKAAGNFTAQAIQEESGSAIDICSKVITITAVVTPPQPVHTKTILDLIWEFIMRLLGKYTPS